MEPCLIRHAEFGQFLCSRWPCGFNHRFIAPAKHVHDKITNGKAFRAAFGHAANGPALHYFAKRESGDIAFGVVHPATHIRIN